MYGAIIGDIAGSVYEFHNIKSKEFKFISANCRFTDDTAMSIAVANALVRSVSENMDFKSLVVEEMQSIGREYPHAGYGGMFRRWLASETPAPYNSFGNGSAMRVSACGLFALSLEEALSLAKESAEVTHSHPEGIKGAQATAAAIYLAKTHKSRDEIRKYIEENFYSLDFTLDEIRPAYQFDVTCQGSVPQAIVAFLESESYEDAIRNAISIGGDSDTIAAVTGGIAMAYYRAESADKNAFTQNIVDKYAINSLLPEKFVRIIQDFTGVCKIRGSV